MVEIKASQNIVQARLRELEEAIASDEEQRQRIIDVSNILSTLRERVKDATFETKRKVFELLLKEIRVGRAEDGATTLNIVYFFSKDLIEANADIQLHSSRMPVRLLWRPV